jgi:acylphosphatase
VSDVVRQVICHVVIRGQVQGVGYRAFVEDEAAIRGLEGWVRNRREGTVEAVFAGPADDVARIIEACPRGRCRRGSMVSMKRRARANSLRNAGRERNFQC